MQRHQWPMRAVHTVGVGGHQRGGLDANWGAHRGANAAPSFGMRYRGTEFSVPCSQGRDLPQLHRDLCTVVDVCSFFLAPIFATYAAGLGMQSATRGKVQGGSLV